MNVGRRGCVALDAAVGLVDPPVTELLASVALDVSDNQVLPLHVWADAGESVLDELEEELARFLGPAGGWAAPLLPLGMVSDTFVVTEERNGALVVDDGLEIGDGLVSAHALDSTANFKHWLEMNALHDCLSLEARNVFAECVGLAHFRKDGPKPL